MNAILILDLDNTILSDKEHPNLLVKRLSLLRTYGKLILARCRYFFKWWRSCYEVQFRTYIF